MSQQNGKDNLFLIWKSDQSRKQYVVGQLTKNGQFEFEYYKKEVNEAISDGFTLLIGFPELNKVYTNNKLFSVFASRLPDRKRKDIDIILDKYGMKEFDEYLLLKRSGARLPIDNLEFIDPILNVYEGMQRIFYMAGVRHYLRCEGKDCMNEIDVAEGDNIILRKEPENSHDRFAVQMLDIHGRLLGYVPRYYSQGITELLDQGKKIICSVYHLNQDKNCNECIKVIMKLG